MHPALTFLSSPLCAGGCSCYCPSTSRAGVYDENTSFRLYFLPLPSLQRGPTRVALPPDVPQRPCPAGTAAQRSQLPPPPHSGPDTSGAFSCRDSGALSPPQIQRMLWMAPVRFGPQSCQSSLVEKEKQGQLLPGFLVFF